MLHCHDGDGDDGDNGIGGDDDGDYDGNDDEDDDDGGVGGWALTQLYHVTLPSRHRSSQLHYFTLHYITITLLHTTLHFLSFSTVTLQCIKLLDFAIPLIRCKTQAKHKQEKQKTNKFETKNARQANKHEKQTCAVQNST